jgi:hypothetical protein
MPDFHTPWYDFEELTQYEGYEAHPDYHSVYTIQLCELANAGFIDWTREDWDWSDVAQSPEVYERVCKKFNDRFWWSEISITPPGRWKQQLLRRIRELAPKYNNLWRITADGLDPLQVGGEYGKRRAIDSGYPETLLSGNADYISGGRDEEYEKIATGNVTEALQAYQEGYHDPDAMFLDELEVFFCHMYTSNVNAY